MFLLPKRAIGLSYSHLYESQPLNDNQSNIAIKVLKENSQVDQFRNISKSSWYSSRNFIVGEVTVRIKIINNQNLIHMAKIIF